MRNRWSRLKVSRRWVIVLAAIAMASVLAYFVFREPSVTLQVVELKQELLRGYQADSLNPGVMVQSETFGSNWVAELELRNNSSQEIQYSGLFSYRHMPITNAFIGPMVRGSAIQDSPRKDRHGLPLRKGLAAAVGPVSVSCLEILSDSELNSCKLENLPSLPSPSGPRAKRWHSTIFCRAAWWVVCLGGRNGIRRKQK